MTVRITFAITPPGHIGPVTRISCGGGDQAVYLARYARYAARQFLAAHERRQDDGSYVVRRNFDRSGQVLATIEAEGEPAGPTA